MESTRRYREARPTPLTDTDVDLRLLAIREATKRRLIVQRRERARTTTSRLARLLRG